MKFALTPGRGRVCPSCGGSNIRKSRSLLEFILRWVFNISPYRCMSCNRRHYRFRFQHSKAGLRAPTKLDPQESCVTLFAPFPPEVYGGNSQQDH
jgi:hypothetical protein